MVGGGGLARWTVYSRLRWIFYPSLLLAHSTALKYCQAFDIRNNFVLGRFILSRVFTDLIIQAVHVCMGHLCCVIIWDDFCMKGPADNTMQCNARQCNTMQCNERSSKQWVKADGGWIQHQNDHQHTHCIQQGGYLIIQTIVIILSMIISIKISKTRLPSGEDKSWKWKQGQFKERNQRDKV